MGMGKELVEMADGNFKVSKEQRMEMWARADALGWSFRDLGTAAGISNTTAGNILKGVQKTPRPKTVYKIMSALEKGEAGQANLTRKREGIEGAIEERLRDFGLSSMACSHIMQNINLWRKAEGV